MNKMERNIDEIMPRNLASLIDRSDILTPAFSCSADVEYLLATARRTSQTSIYLSHSRKRELCRTTL